MNARRPFGVLAKTLREYFLPMGRKNYPLAEYGEFSYMAAKILSRLKNFGNVRNSSH